jgi:CHC2 zinc finger
MSERPRLDFAGIKARVSLTQVMEMLDLRLKKSGSQFRGSCPVHGGGDRTLVITPSEGFYCFAEKKGGDQIALYAHVRDCNNYDAAAALSQHFRIEQPKRAERPAEPPTDALQPLTYLETDHEILDVLGLSPAVCQALGAGYAPKGTMLGRVAIPLRLEDGTLVGYFGIATKPDQEPLLKFPPNLEERCSVQAVQPVEEPDKRSADDMRKILRVV